MSDHVAPAHSRVGVFTETPLDGGASKTCDIVCCAHCAYMWLYQPGSGRRRGFCMLCNGLTCGRKWCREHAHCSRHQQIENMEKGRAIDHSPILVRGS